MVDVLLVDFVCQQFKVYWVVFELVCFEIIEIVVVGNFDVVVQMMYGMCELGCWFVFDDFGFGMLLFIYFKCLLVDYVKIDGVFVKDMVKDVVDFLMVEVIYNIVYCMGLCMVVEFVQNDVIIEMLCGLGVDYVQGYGVEKLCLLDDVMCSSEVVFEVWLFVVV